MMMSKWDQMMPRDRDLWIAEHVIGWCSSWEEHTWPSFTTDAAADYLVLERIRKGQRDGQPIVDWERYLDSLFECFCFSDKSVRRSGCRTYEFIVNYEVGAYSHAAYLALEGRDDA